MNIGELAFPYYESYGASLRKLYITSSTNSIDERNIYELTLSSGDERDQRKCTTMRNLAALDSMTGLFSFIQNPTQNERFPLLIRVPAELNKIKVDLTIKSNLKEMNDDQYLIILKALECPKDETALRELLEEQPFNGAKYEVSRIKYKELPTSEDDGLQDVTADDVYDTDLFESEKMNVSFWMFNATSDEYSSLFKFDIWVDHAKERKSLRKLKSHGQHKHEKGAGEPTVNTSKIVPIKYSKIRDYQKELRFHFEDGPEFRAILEKYEHSYPDFKKNFGYFRGELDTLGRCLVTINRSKQRLAELVENIYSLQCGSILKDQGFFEFFRKALYSTVDPLVKNLVSFLHKVNDKQLLRKISTTSLTKNVGASDTSYGQNDLTHAKKHFENSSKEYYMWLNKYLANDKERPQEKLLLKRKNFEKAKFDYYNYLNQLYNNQYLSKLLEKLFEFVSAYFDKEYSENNKFKKNQFPLLDNFDVFLSVMSKFNSEKLQFRQMIEASASNEELSQVVHFGRLTSSYPNEENDSACTKENLNLIFNIKVESDKPDFDIESSIPQSENAEMMGILYTLGGQKKPGWHKEWVVIKDGQLTEYADWRKAKKPLSEPIEIALSSVKITSVEKRQNCFEIFTSSRTRKIFQAMNLVERKRWLKALYNAGQVVDPSRLTLNKEEKEKKRTLGKLITNGEKFLLPNKSNHEMSSPASITPISPLNDKNHFTLVKSGPQTSNYMCCDCGSTESVEWVSVNLLIILCIKCSSYHRHMGSHVSKIKSLKLDHFSPELELLLTYVNNSRANSYLLQNMPSQLAISPNASDSDRLSFIVAKYGEKKYKAKYADVNDLLINSIKHIDIPETIKYITCGADVNIKISTFSPNQGKKTISVLQYSLRKYVEVKGNHSKPPLKLFALAELLILNGSDINSVDKISADEGYTKEAVDYWTKRRSKLNGKDVK